LKAHKPLMTVAMEIRDAAKDVARTWKTTNGASTKAPSLSAAWADSCYGTHRPAARPPDSDFLTGATRSLKDRMQHVTRALGLNIGCLYQVQAKFERGLADLQTIDAPLAAYIRQARLGVIPW